METISQDTVNYILENLCADDMEGRYAGSPGSQKAQGFLTKWLADSGFEPAGAPSSYEQTFLNGTNLVAIWRPEGQEKALPRILIGAHYDHLGKDCSPHPAAKSNVCNGCADNGAAVAAALGAMEYLKGRVKYPVALILWDAEEIGLLGSEFFLSQPSFPLQELQLFINLDIVGMELFPGLQQVHLLVGSESGGQACQADILKATAPSGIQPVFLSYAFGHARSDVTSFFYKKTGVPFVLFTDGPGEVYHTTADDFDHLNRSKVLSIASVVARLALISAHREEKYPYHHPVMIGGQVLPIYKDAASLLIVFQALAQQIRAAGQSDSQSKALDEMVANLQMIVSRGENAFSQDSAVLLGEAGRQLSNLTKR